VKGALAKGSMWSRLFGEISVKHVHVIIEFMEPGAPAAAMRWERRSTTEGGGTFELIGRSFEVAQREEGAGFAESLMAFFKGAVVRKEDVADVLSRME
jgi:hypothetical protein